MKGYLLDNNAIFRWHGGNPRIAARIADLPIGAPLRGVGSDIGGD